MYINGIATAQLRYFMADSTLKIEETPKGEFWYSIFPVETPPLPTHTVVLSLSPVSARCLKNKYGGSLYSILTIKGENRVLRTVQDFSQQLVMLFGLLFNN